MMFWYYDTLIDKTNQDVIHLIGGKNAKAQPVWDGRRYEPAGISYIAGALFLLSHNL